jgi:hypothetical protein
MKIKSLILGLTALLPATLLTSCVVEVVALAAIVADAADGGEKEDIPKLVMHDGSDGSYPIAKHMTGTSTYVHHPYTNKPVNVFGKPSGKLIGSGSKKYYIPHLTRYPTAEKIEGKPGYYLNPYDKREVRMARSKPGALVSSPSAGTFFYLPK